MQPKLRKNTLTYNGFSSSECECDYVIEDRGDDCYMVVFTQTAKSKTDITAMVAVMVNKVLIHEFPGISYGNIDFYINHKDTPHTIEKVTFGVICSNSSVLSLMLTNKTKSFTSVDMPLFSQVTDPIEQKRIIDVLDNALSL